MTRKTILYIACSLDGYIAKPGDDLAFLSIVQREGEDYGYGAFISSVDTVIMGRRTYDWVMTQVDEFPHAELDAYIVTHTPRPAVGKTQFYTGDLGELVARLKSREGGHIFIDGGGQVVAGLLKNRLIDELIISIIPILVGEGTRLFQEGYPEQELELVSVRQFEAGLAQLHYRRK